MTHGHLEQTGNSSSSLLPILNNKSKSAEASAPHDYPSYDPFASSTCSQCRYLPNCLGGCPKEKFDDRQYYLGSICETWESDANNKLFYRRFVCFDCDFAGFAPFSFSFFMNARPRSSSAARSIFSVATLTGLPDCFPSQPFNSSGVETT